jgi:hypothetical protein
MIFDVLNLIRQSLQNYVLEVAVREDTQDIVVLNNVVMATELGGLDERMKEKIVMTLVNIQEESTLKNSTGYRFENGHTVYQNPPTYLNLFILFSVLHNDYEQALRLLSRVIEFFQWRRKISPSLSPGSENEGIGDFEVVMDLYSLTFEQLNHLWGTLGGKQLPFALYRARLVALEAEKRQAEEPVITEISVNKEA